MNYFSNGGFRVRALRQEFETASSSGGVMSVILTFASKWVRWYGVLRHAKEFSFVDSVRYGLWLARS